MANPALQFQLLPVQMADFRESLDDLEQRFTNFWAGAEYPMRLISWTRRHSFAPTRAALHRDADAVRAARAGGDERGWWRWRHLTEYRRMYETVEAIDPPLAVDHWLICWPPKGMAQPEAIRQSLKAAFLLPDVRPAALPALIPGRYLIRDTFLEPEDPQDPYLRRTHLSRHRFWQF